MNNLNFWLNEYMRTTDGKYASCRLEIKGKQFDVYYDMNKEELTNLHERVFLFLKEWNQHDKK